ncbi:short-chain dehydrogenase/reductase SDR [Rhodococcus rhodochrous ATCC 21198]|nr:short-chain dehydrogenase/reductase SDR [Rhodococcus rhodochrous ATCC 21198]
MRVSGAMTETRPLALVTGASSGIGLELARLFGRDGYDLILVARSDALDDATRALAATGAAVIPVRADLRTVTGVEEVCTAVTATGRPLAAAALNAGTGQGGLFVDTGLEDQLEVVDVNVRSTVHLAKYVLDGMAGRGTGRVLITSSVVSEMPGPYQVVYNASKSFLQSFSEGLHEELRGTGVTVTALMPGATDTPFFRKAGMADAPIARGPKDDPAKVARKGYEAMLKGKRKVVASSPMSKAMAAAATVTPDSVKAFLHRFMAAPASAPR